MGAGGKLSAACILQQERASQRAQPPPPAAAAAAPHAAACMDPPCLLPLGQRCFPSPPPASPPLAAAAVPEGQPFIEQYGLLSPIPDHDGTDCLKWDPSLWSHAEHFKGGGRMRMGLTGWEHVCFCLSASSLCYVEYYSSA